MGSSPFSASILDYIVNHDYIKNNHISIDIIYTKESKPQNRGRKITPTAVNITAQKLNIPVLTPKSLRNEEELSVFNKYNLDLVVVVAYGLIIPKTFLDCPKYGFINIHASLLPKWRGAAPIERSIEAGDDKTGITIMQMDAGLDTGNMISKHEVDILPEDYIQDIYKKLLIEAQNAIINTIIKLNENHHINSTAQNNDLATYAHKISPAEGMINWQQDANKIYNKVRALNNFPKMYFIYNNKKFIILKAKVVNNNDNFAPGKIIQSKNTLVIICGTDALSIEVIQVQSKSAMNILEFCQGYKLEGTL